jgi:hypothetical protein
MGGNAFEGLKRLPATEYKDYEAKILTHLESLYQHFAPLRYYRQKPDFGDMDVVVAGEPVSRRVFESFLKDIGADDVFYNGSIYSFRYADFQVDLIHVDPALFETAQFYFAYNDLNNLIGRVAHAFGVKFGWDGLTYQIRTESGHRPQKIVLSRDPEQIYRFLGYDYARWQEGFDTLEAIFSFVASSRYFNPALYALQNLNHANRTRNRKRKTYVQFLAWLTDVGFENTAFESEVKEGPLRVDKSLYLIKLHNAFPAADLLGQLKVYAEENAAHDARKAKFSGHRVSVWTGLKGSALGRCLALYTRRFGAKNEYHAFLDAHSAAEIQAHFMAFYESEKASD